MTERGIATILIRGFGLFLVLKEGAQLLWYAVGYGSAMSAGRSWAIGPMDQTVWDIFGYTGLLVGLGIVLLLFSDGLIRFISTPPGPAARK